MVVNGSQQHKCKIEKFNWFKIADGSMIKSRKNKVMCAANEQENDLNTTCSVTKRQKPLVNLKLVKLVKLGI